MMRTAAWWLLKAYGELAYRCGRYAGYHWALRAMCNGLHRDWYGRPCGKVFVRVGWPKW